MSVAINSSTDIFCQWLRTFLPQHSEWTVLSAIRSSPFSKGGIAKNSPLKSVPFVDYPTAIPYV